MSSNAPRSVDSRDKRVPCTSEGLSSAVEDADEEDIDELPIVLLLKSMDHEHTFGIVSFSGYG